MLAPSLDDDELLLELDLASSSLGRSLRRSISGRSIGWPTGGSTVGLLRLVGVAANGVAAMGVDDIVLNDCDTLTGGVWTCDGPCIVRRT